MRVPVRWHALPSDEAAQKDVRKFERDEMERMGLMGEILCGIGSCEAVQASRYAQVGPVPVAAFGVVGSADSLCCFLAISPF